MTSTKGCTLADESPSSYPLRSIIINHDSARWNEPSHAPSMLFRLSQTRRRPSWLLPYNPPLRPVSGHAGRAQASATRSPAYRRKLELEELGASVMAALVIVTAPAGGAAWKHPRPASGRDLFRTSAPGRPQLGAHAQPPSCTLDPMPWSAHFAYCRGPAGAGRSADTSRAFGGNKAGGGGSGEHGRIGWRCEAHA